MSQVLLWLLFLSTTTSTALGEPVAQIRRLLRHLPERASGTWLLLVSIVFLFIVKKGSLLVGSLIEPVLLLVEVAGLAFSIDFQQLLLLLATELLQSFELCLLLLLLMLGQD